MDTENYIEERLINQINWYEKKSATNKKRHLLFKTLTLFLSASIPVLAIFIQTDNVSGSINEYLQITFGIAGFLLVALNGWGLIFNHQDLWTHYRQVAEELKHEKNLYENSSGVFREAKYPKELLVERVEKIISPRHSN